MRLLVVAAALTALVASALPTSPADAQPRKRYTSRDGHTVIVSRDENGRTRTRVVVQKRSFLDGGTEVAPGERKYRDYVEGPNGLMPFGVVPGVHPFTVTSQFTITGVMAIISFSIVLVVGFWKHGFHFFSLFVPHGTPKLLLPLIFLIELVSFMVRPFSLGLRLFVAMIAGHILMEVFGSFIVSGFNAGPMGWGISILSFVFIVGVSALELLVCAIQAYVFALLTSLYLNDAINLH